MYFTPHLISSDKSGNVVSLLSPKIWGPEVHVVPRMQCSFRRITLKSKTRNALQAAKLRIGKELLPHENKLRIVKDKNGLGASAWSYSDNLPADKQSIPESLAREGMETGTRLISCFNGVEGQVWEDYALLASRWWASKPSSRQWQVFLRSAPVEGAEISLPDPVRAGFRADLPLFDMDAGRLAALFSPQRIATAGVMAGACAFLYLGAQYIHYKGALASADKKITQISGQTGQILSQRRRALANMSAAKRLDVLGSEATILSGFDGVAEVLAGKGFALRSVSIGGGEMEVRVMGKVPANGPEFVAKLEAMPALKGVSLIPAGTNAFLIKAELAANNQLWHEVANP